MKRFGHVCSLSGLSAEQAAAVCYVDLGTAHSRLSSTAETLADVLEELERPEGEIDLAVDSTLRDLKDKLGPPPLLDPVILPTAAIDEEAQGYGWPTTATHRIVLNPIAVRGSAECCWFEMVESRSNHGQTGLHGSCQSLCI